MIDKPKKPRGGKRAGAGRKAKWGPTIKYRIPVWLVAAVKRPDGLDKLKAFIEREVSDDSKA